MKRKAAKTILALALCGAMTAGALAGCGGNEKETAWDNRQGGTFPHGIHDWLSCPDTECFSGNGLCQNDPPPF